jgi:hypothetical protein
MEAAMTITSVSVWRRLLCFDELVGEGSESAFDLPEDLSTLSDAELQDLHDEAVEAFDDARSGDLDAEAVARLTGLRDAISTLRAEQTRRVDATAEARAQIEAMTAEVHPADPADEADPDPEDAEATDDDPDADAETDEAEAEHVVPELVTASTRPALGAVARRAPVPATRPTGAGRRAGREGLELVMTAAADVPGHATGSRYRHGLDDVAESFHDRARMLANDGRRVPVVRIDKGLVSDELTVHGNYGDLDTIEKARRLPDGGAAALVASGGWCGPSTPLYNVCRIDAGDGLIDLPTVKVQRAGILIPSPIVMPTPLSSVSWHWTNQNDIDATPPSVSPKKPCITIPCPTWTDHQLEAYGICVTHGNLADRSFPELTKEYIAMVMNAHLHAMSGAQIAAIAAGSTAVAGVTVGSAASSVLSAAELAAEFYIEKYHMSMNTVMEAVFPAWTEEVIRADLAARAGVDLVNVNDSYISSLFTNRDLRPQFVQDWQPLANATAYPTSIEFLLYPAGTWIKGDGGTLDLGVVRDSTLNATNDFTAAWSEDFWLVAKACAESLVVTCPLKVDGVTACCA